MRISTVAEPTRWSRHGRSTRVRRSPGVAAAVFSSGPERAVYNNALLGRDLAAGARADALDAMESAYASAGVARFAAWVHESDEEMRRDLDRRGYTLDTSTRAMGMALADTCVTPPEMQLGPPEWAEHLRIIGAPPGFLGDGEQLPFHV